MNVSEPVRLQSLDAAGRGLAVEFFKQGDRYGHRILAIGREGAVPILESIEGDSQTVWPPSPPLQEVSRHNSAILGVGMAGRSHWSLSAELFAGEPALVFDVACRVAEPPQWLGSSYVGPPSIAADGAHAALMSAAQLSLEIFCEPVAGAGAARLNRSADRLLVEANIGIQASTFRWKYRVLLA